MKNYFLSISFLFFFSPLVAQHQEISEKPEMWKGKQHNADDTTSILHAFKSGHIHGHFRYFFMATDNKAGLTDYYAHALGGGIKFETATFKHFQFGVSGFFIFNIGSSNLEKPDPKTNQLNRYELGLFDIVDPANKKDIDRLEELYLKYNWKNAHIVLGKQLINTPFINLQDGRMRPTEVEGLYAELNSLKNTKIEAGLIYAVSPRSTVEWFKVKSSIGLYPQGVNPDGTKSDYAENLESKGIAIASVKHEWKEGFSIQAHELFVENMFNSFLLQGDYTFRTHRHGNIIGGLQYLQQNAIEDGGNEDPAKTYFQKNGKAFAFGVKLGWENKKWKTSANYTRITKQGRYLMPREWGRDPFYTFLPRERNEGLGDVNAWVGKLAYDFSKAKLKVQAAFGYYDLPDVLNYALNKYGMPSYTQLNLDIRYAFTGLLKGLEPQLLFIYKSSNGDTHGNAKYEFNKVDMSQWNFLLNYHF